MADQDLPALLDREIATEQQDAFGHRDFAKALRSLIESPLHQPPFSIGLLGKWGSGKSSVKALYLSDLADDQSKIVSGLARSERIRPITFNAWRFGGDNIKRALLRHVYLEIGGDNERLTDALFRRMRESTSKARPWAELVRDAFDRWIWSLLQVVVVLATIGGLFILITRRFTIQGEFATPAIVLALAWLAREALKYLFSWKRLIIPRYANMLRIDEPRTSAEEYEDLLISQLGDFKKGSGRSCERLVVFVDDLDRLSADEMVSGLDAVRTFLEIPQAQLPASFGLVFVISCDEDRVAEALAGRSRTSRSPELPATVLDKSSARRYLDRIFQFRLEVPDPPKLDMRNFAREKLQEHLGDIATDLRESKVSIETLVDRLIHVSVRSPRNAIQILNAFAQSWWLAKRREREGAGTERPGGLQQGAVTNHPIALAAVCALRVNFPDFYNDLLRDQELIRHFVDVFHRGQALEVQPEAARAILASYAKEKGELRSEYHGLRQYLISLQGIRWPKTLQPLLLLAQDPVTRRLGDNALPIYEAFVSGDHNGVLRLLGREKDGGPLSDDDTRLLRSMSEELDHETDVRRDNAAACIAAIADRLPASQARYLVSPLARRLADSAELRWRLGVDNIRRVLPEASNEDRQDVASSLIEDLLKASGDTPFLKDTMQRPSLDEAAQMAESACDLALWVRAESGLPRRGDTALLDWLVHRRVSVDGREYVFPFSRLEAWMDEHEVHLLPALKARYTEMAIDEFEADGIGDDGRNALLKRTRDVFGWLWDEGEKSRAILWQQANRLVAVRDADAAKLAWTQVEGHVGGANAMECAAFVALLAKRLNQSVDDEGGWGIDSQAGGNALIAIVTQRHGDMDSAASTALADLAIAWGPRDEQSALACRLADLLQQANPEQLSRVLADWVGRLFSDLPLICTTWVASHFESALTDAQRTQLTKQLNNVVNKDSVSDAETAAYQTVVCGLSAAALSSSTLTSHFTNLCQQIQNRHNNPSNYLRRIFVAVPTLISHLPPGPLGSMLHQLFANAKSNPELFGWLHGQMANVWPHRDTSLDPYNPDQIFDDAIATAKSQPQVSTMGDVLLSVAAMTKRQVVATDRETEVARAACVVWTHHPTTAVDVLRSVKTLPPDEDVAGLANQISADRDEDRTRLINLWSILAPRIGVDGLTNVGRSIVRNQMRGYDQEPDFCFARWIDSCGEHTGHVLRSLAADPSLNDEQTSRVWLQVLRLAGPLGREFLLSALPLGLTSDTKSATVRTVLDGHREIDGVFMSKDERYQLAHALLDCLAGSSSQEVRNRIAKWIFDLDAEAVLKELKRDEVSEDALDALRQQFPKSRYLK